MEREILTYKDKEYQLRYSARRLAMVEDALGNVPILSIYSEKKGMFTVNQLLRTFAYGLKGTDGEYISVAKGLDFGEKLLGDENYGYLKLTALVSEALTEDCGFLFQGA